MSAPARTAPLVIDWSVPADARTQIRPTLRNPIAPFRKQRIESPSLEQLTRIVAAIQEETESITAPARSLPDAGASVIYKNVTFGGSLTLEHRIPVGNSVTSQTVPLATSVAAFPEQIQFQIFNQVGGNALVYRTAIDERTITLWSDATFAASIRLFVLP